MSEFWVQIIVRREADEDIPKLDLASGLLVDASGVEEAINKAIAKFPKIEEQT